MYRMWTFLAIVAILSGQICAWPWSRQDDTPKDPEIQMTVEEIIMRWGYPVERYEVTTQDGYILTLFRIPHGKNETNIGTRRKPPILLVHGLDASCVCFISNLPEQDSSYTFADGGLDVWLGNLRGNLYGRRHITLTHRQKQFWDFSWDEMAQYDLPAMIDFIMNTTGNPFVYYVGHSMGTTVAFALLATDPTYNRKIRKYYSWGSATTATNSRGALRNLLSFVSTTDATIQRLGMDPGQFLTSNAAAKKMVQLSCGPSAAELICSNAMFMAEGEDTGQMNKTRLPVFMAHLPSGTSWRTVAHFGQVVKSGIFQKYDYSTPAKNRLRYSQDNPPLYDITLITAPVALYNGDKDILAPPEDIDTMARKLRNVADVRLINFNHVDLIWGSRAADEIYKPMLREILADYANATRRRNG